MSRLAAVFHMSVVLVLVVFSTWQFFLGNFAGALATLPLLIVYYLVIVAWRKK